MKKLILASTSLRRKELLAEAGFQFEVIPSDYEEDMTLSMSPKELVVYLGKEKARAVAEKNRDAVVIGADTFIVFKNQVLGKPHTPEKAKETLRRLSGNKHVVMTGFSIMCKDKTQEESRAIETEVYFKQLTDKEIDDYISTGEPLDRAGAYAIQGLGKVLVDKIEGDYTNIVGFPIQDITDVLKEFEIVPTLMN